MSYLSKDKYESKLKKIEEKNKSKERKLKLKKAKSRYKLKFKLPPTSKLILLVVTLLCIEIVLFCQYIMIKFGDTSALYVLIGIPTTLVPTVLAYYNKSKAENTSGGIVFETAISKMNQQNVNCEDYIESEIYEEPIHSEEI